jgi:hypothetical protein
LFGGGGGSASQQKPIFNQQTAPLQAAPYGNQQPTLDSLQTTHPQVSVTTMDNSFPPQQHHNATYTPAVMQVQQPPGKI